MSAVAKRYAYALFLAAQEQQVLPEVEQDMKEAARALTSVSKLWLWLRSPAVPLAHKRAVFTASLRGLEPLVRNTLLLLLDRKREREIPAVAKALRAYALEERGETDAVFMTATALRSSQRQAVQEVFAERLGRKLCVQWVVDGNLLGGMVARVGDRLYDGSLRTQLMRFAHIVAQSESDEGLRREV